MKTIEEQAAEFSKFDSATDIGTDLGSYRQGLFEGFLAGYKAAQDQVALDKLKRRIKYAMHYTKVSMLDTSKHEKMKKKCMQKLKG